MTDETAIVRELTRVVEAQQLAGIDPGAALRRGRRHRLRRAAAAGAAGLAAAAVVTVAVAGAGGEGVPAPTFEDPAGRESLVAVGGERDGYPDLLTRRHVGGATVDIEGFGWPIEGMAPVSTTDGTVAFPELDKADAESMCLPLLDQGAPGVPPDQWRHDTGWVDDFPSRATFVTSYVARHQGRTYYAACTLPGDFATQHAVDLSQPPSVDDDAAIREQCAYLGHIDFGAWTVGAADAAGGVTAAALVSPEGYVARCVLSADADRREVQLSATPVDDVAGGGVFYRSGGRDPFVLVGVAGTEVASLRVSTDSSQWQAPVTDGVYAVVRAVGAGDPYEDVVEAYDANGERVAVARAAAPRPPGDMLVPSACFTPVESGSDGC